MFNYMLTQTFPDGETDTYILAPKDLNGVSVIPGDKMIDENGKDVFTVFCASSCPADIFDNRHDNGTDPKFQEICFDEHGYMRFTDECVHYFDRHTLVSWCLNHPDDCGNFDRNRYFSDHDAYMNEWKSQ